jgi:hypothetical protein
MSDAVTIFAPLFGFMLLPVWIPILTEVVGRIVDQIGPRRENELADRLATLKERSHANRARQPQVVLAEAA